MVPASSVPDVSSGLSDAMTKSNYGNFFEDFRIGQRIQHAVPRTIRGGDMALYIAPHRRPPPAALRRRVRPVASASRARLSTTCSSSTWSSARRVARRLAQRGRQPRVRRRALPAPGLPRRHPARRDRGHRQARDVATARSASSGCTRAATTSAARRSSRSTAGRWSNKRDPEKQTGHDDAPRAAAAVAAGRPLRARRAQPRALRHLQWATGGRRLLGGLRARRAHHAPRRA